MLNENINQTENVGEMYKRREIMADGRRYLIYYTFGESGDVSKAETKIIESEIKSESI
ncbi:MAG: hypothetical protein ABI954_02910 [Pyrinomonadaceae bacterium]